VALGHHRSHSQEELPDLHKIPTGEKAVVLALDLDHRFSFDCGAFLGHGAMIVPDGAIEKNPEMP